MTGQYQITVEDSFSAAHHLREYEGRCARLHGHNWKVRVYVDADRLNSTGMVVDFKILRAMLREVLADFDHRNLNDVGVMEGRNPTAENLAQVIFCNLAGKLPDGIALHRVEIWESEHHSACYGHFQTRGE